MPTAEIPSSPKRNLRTLQLTTLAVLLFSGCSHLPGNAHSPCLRSGSPESINELLKSGGAGAQIALCPGEEYDRVDPVIFTAKNQSIFTQGYPTDSTRALLRVSGKAQATAILGNCSQCSGIVIRNIQVDGNRQALGYLKKGGALIEIGGSVLDQVVDHVRAFEPRGWSVLHVAEGALNCAHATITNNEIGPSGHEDHTWADGISLACAKSEVSDNEIIDATDGAIVVFGAPGSLVTRNIIIAQSRTLLGGINLVDYLPYDGKYTDTDVTQNRIEARGAMIKVGIAIGPAVWSFRDSTPINFGGFVTDNVLTGNYFGYGIAVNGVRNFTLTGNRSEAAYGGTPGARCRGRKLPSPQPFVMNRARSSGTFQVNFSEGNAENLICLDPIR